MGRNTPLHEFGWEAFRKAETHESHDTRMMFSIQSKSTPYAFGCACGNVLYTYVSSDATPICTGGYTWSFVTLDLHD